MKDCRYAAWHMALVTALIWPVAAHAQATGTAGSCTKKSAADSGKVVLGDSTAPQRWDKTIRDKVARHEACLGMTMDMLVKSWGGPRKVTDLRTETDTTSQFFYHGATVVLVNRVVKAIRPPSGS
jgi:hypothetical protein